MANLIDTENYNVQVSTADVVVIPRKSDGAQQVLQGDDSIQFQQNLENISALDYPIGPFNTLDEQADYMLEQYF